MLVIEEQRWQFAARLEPVAAVGSFDRVDEVPELAQTIDVAAHGSFTDSEPLGEQAARPVAADLQQRQQ